MRRRRRLPPWPLIAVATVFLGTGGGACLALVRMSFGDNGDWSLDHYIAALTQSYLLLQPLEASLLMAAAVAVTATALGASLAFLLLRTDMPGAAAARVLVPLPNIIPSFQLACAWIVLFSHGGIAAALLGGASPLPAYGGIALWLVLSLHLYLPAFLTAASALANLDSSYEEAARLSGLGRLAVLRHVVLPLLRPALVSGLLISFALTMEEFGAPSLLGQPTGFVTLTVQIYQLVTTPPLAFGDASALSVFLGLVALAVLLLNLRLLRTGAAVTVSGKAGRGRRTPLGTWRWPIALLVWTFLLLAAVGPLLALAVVSVLGAWGNGYGLSNMTTAHYAALVGSTELRRAMITTAELALGAAALASVIGLTAAFGRIRLRSRIAVAMDSMSFVALSMPGLVLGLALILAFSGGSFSLYGSFGILLLAYVLRFAGLASRSAEAGLRQLSPELEAAARIAGLRPAAVVGRITLPLLRPALAGGAALVLLSAVKEISATSLLVSQGHETMAYEAYLRFMEGNYTQGAAISMITIGVSIPVFALAARGGAIRAEA